MKSSLLGVLFTLIFTATLSAKEPDTAPNPTTAKLLSLVSDDVTFCVAVQGLRDNVTKGGGLDAVLKKLTNPDDVKMLQELQEMLLKPLGLTSKQVIEDLLGDSVVVAFKQGPPDKPEQEDGIILVHARDEKLLAEVVERINQAQKEGNELRDVHKEKGIFRRELTNGNNEYFFVQKNILAFSAKKQLVQDAYDRIAFPPKENKIANEFQKLGIGQSLVGFWLNPRSFDDDLQAQAKTAKGSEKKFLSQFLAHWQAVESFGLGLDLFPNLQLSLKVRANTERFPKHSLALLNGLSQPTELWSIIPEDALFAMAFRIDPQQVIAVIESFLDDKDAEKLKKDLLEQLTPFLGTDDVKPILKGTGPDVGFWIIKPTEKASLPYGVLATRLRDGDPGKDAQKMLEEAAEFAFRLATTAQKGIKLERDKLPDGTPIRIMTIPDAPKGLRPAFTTQHQYFLVGSHPNVFQTFAKPKPMTFDEVPIIRMSAPAVKDYLNQHGPFIAGLAEENKKGKAADILKEIKTIVAGLDELEKLEITAKPTGNTISINVRMTPAKKGK